MTVEFKNNIYLTCIKDNENFNSNTKIADYAKSHLEFQIGDVNYSRFEQKYLAEEFQERPITPLSTTASKAVKSIAQAIGHLATACIQMPRGFADEELRLHLFHARRDYQEFYGRILCLFHNTWGEYHIQESAFHKTCYDLHGPFQAPETAPPGRSSLNRIDTSVVENACKVLCITREQAKDLNLIEKKRSSFIVQLSKRKEKLASQDIKDSLQALIDDINNAAETLKNARAPIPPSDTPKKPDNID